MYNYSVEIQSKKTEMLKTIRPMVLSIASKFLHKFDGMAFCKEEVLPDLIQEGMLGALRAFDRYDSSRVAKFSSYAYMYIFSAIQMYTALMFGVCKQPHHTISNEMRGVQVDPFDEETANNNLGLTSDFSTESLEFSDRYKLILYIMGSDLSKYELACVCKKYIDSSIHIPNTVLPLFDFFASSGILKLKRSFQNLDFEV